MTAPRIAVDPTEVEPGQPCDLAVRLVNGDDAPRAFAVRAVGLADSWVSPPVLTDELAPGAEVLVHLTVTLPFGFPASRQAVGVVAEPADGSPPARADTTLVVADGSALRLGLEPADVRGGRRARFAVRLTNRGGDDLDVDLDAHAPAGRLRVDFEPPALRIPPGATVRARGTVRGSRPAGGRARRLPFVVAARGPLTPVHAEGSFTQSPVLSSAVLKVVAVIAVLALWVGGLAFALDRFGDDGEDDPGGETAAAVDGEDGGDGAGGAGGGGGDGDGQGGEDGDGEDDEGAGGAGAGTKVGGTVEAREPEGVQVRIEPVSLVEEDTARATLVGARRSAAVGKRAGPAQQVGRSTPARTTRTDEAGVWAFAGVQGPGFFLVTFSKAGYGQRSFVIEVGEDGEPVELDALLEAGPGAISGTVVGPDGPLGGVDISITDGTVVLGARTPTTGDGIGTFTVEGLTTPGAYLVTASRRGYGTETALVELGSSERESVALRMVAGVGSVTGTVSSPDGPVGGVTVSITDGTTTRTATTLTEGPVGSYTLPQLPVPGTYVLTVEGRGWATSTQELALTGDLTVPVTLEPTTGRISGRIRGADGTGLNGVGVTLEGQDVVLKNTSVESPPGGYELDGVPPGTYVVSFSLFGFETESTVVELAQGEDRTLDVTVDRPVDLEVPRDATISGRVVDSTTNLGIAGATARITGDTTTAPVTTLSDGSFSFTGLPPGTFTVLVEATGYEPVTERVTVGPGGSATIALRMLPLATVSGTVRSAADGALVHGATVTLTRAGTNPPVVLTTQTGPDIAAGLAAGEFRFADIVREGNYLLEASHPEFEPMTSPIAIRVDAGEDESGIEVALNRLGRLRIAAAVPSASATAVATGATITVTGGAVNETRTVDEAFEVFALPSGAYTVTISLAGHAPRTTAPIPVPLNSTVDRHFVLSPDRSDAAIEVVYAIDGATQPVPSGGVLVSGVFGFDDPPDGSSSPPSPLRSTAGPFSIVSGDVVVPGWAVPLDGIADLQVFAPDFNGRTVDDEDLRTPTTVVLTPVPGQARIDVGFTGAPDPVPTVSASVLTGPPGVTGVTAVVTGTSVVLRHPASSGGGVDRVPVGTYTVSVSAPGHSSQTVPITVVPSPVPVVATVTLAEHATLTVTARGTDVGAGTPAHDVPATFVLTPVSPPGPSITLPSGGGSATSVTFTGLEAGTQYAVTASGPDLRLQAPVPDQILAPGEAAAVEVHFDVLGSISGRVQGLLAGSHADLAGVVVRATGPGGTFEATTGGDGRFTIRGLDAGTFDVTVVGPAPGWDLADGTRTGVGVVGGSDTPVGDLVLDALPATLTGLVTDGSGDPLPGVSVRVRYSIGGGPAAVLTGPDGRYEITDLTPVPSNVEFSKADHRSVTVVAVPLPRGGTYTLNEQLADNLNTILGRVRASFGGTLADVGGVTVSAIPVGGTTAAGTATADADGRFSIGQLPAGDYRVTVTLPTGYDAPAAYPQVTVTDGATRDVGTIQLVGHTRPVRVTVTGGDGQPSEGAMVTLTATGGTAVTQGPSPTDALGRVTFSNLAPGTYTASAAPRADREGGSATAPITVVASADSTPVDVGIALDEGLVALSLTFDGASTDVTVTVRAGGTVVRSLVASSTASVFLAPGDYTFSFSATGWEADDEDVTVTKGVTTPLPVTVTQLGRIVVNVTPADATITITPGGVQADGWYRPGAYTVTASKDGESDSAPAVVAAGATTTVTLDVPAPSPGFAPNGAGAGAPPPPVLVPEEDPTTTSSTSTTLVLEE